MALVQRNIEIDSEIWSELKSKAIERNKNVREFAGEILSSYLRNNKIGKPRKKAIIIAAGMGTRLMPLTKDKPKCMLEVNGKTILQRQIEVYKECGFTDIIFIKGYKKEVINYPDLKYYINTNYKNNNILASLFYAEKEMDEELVVSYSDILFERDIVEKLLQSRADISLVIDTDWLSHYKGRYQHPVEEAEKVDVEDGRVTKIAKSISPPHAYGEFIGMAKFSAVGTEILKSNYRIVKKLFADKPFHDAVSVEKAYLTDMIQELIDRGYDISTTDIEGGWVEIDTHEDLENAIKVIK